MRVHGSSRSNILDNAISIAGDLQAVAGIVLTGSADASIFENSGDGLYIRSVPLFSLILSRVLTSSLSSDNSVHAWSGHFAAGLLAGGTQSSPVPSGTYIARNTVSASPGLASVSFGYAVSHSEEMRFEDNNMLGTISGKPSPDCPASISRFVRPTGFLRDGLTSSGTFGFDADRSTPPFNALTLACFVKGLYTPASRPLRHAAKKLKPSLPTVRVSDQLPAEAALAETQPSQKKAAPPAIKSKT